MVKIDVESINGDPDWKTRAAGRIEELDDLVRDGMVLVIGNLQEGEESNLKQYNIIDMLYPIR